MSGRVLDLSVERDKIKHFSKMVENEVDSSNEDDSPKDSTDRGVWDVNRN